MTRDFTHQRYNEIIQTLKSNGYHFLKFSEYPKACRFSPVVILRHDVDRHPRKSLALALLEHELGVRSTYFFRVKRCSFNLAIMKLIKEMGHEIGYHYEDLSCCGGDHLSAWQSFKRNLSLFSPVCTVRTIAMHGSPFSPWDNRNLWDYYDYRELGISLEAYRDIDWSRFIYLTDTGRNWNGKHNLRDKVRLGDFVQMEDLKDSECVMRFISMSRPDLVISVHPERWNDSIVDWLLSLLLDSCAKILKRIISLSRYNK
ncbi:MAG: hypothetical protein DRH12_10115 [Deltaproteobacteria bacterium]|nr:MAG: hypothetical protein DRH12_10115 [Deltaproteobacteria bacterium]